VRGFLRPHHEQERNEAGRLLGEALVTAAPTDQKVVTFAAL
jgi:hypothetical protein